MRFPALIFSLLCPAMAMAELSVHGNAPFAEYPGLQQKLNQIWNYEKTKYLGDRQVASPEIYFFPFLREQESPEWVAWQNSWIRENPSIWEEWTKISGDKAPKEITKEWIDENIERLFPFPKTFRAFHYDRTNKIQINPATTFLPFYVNDPYGMKSDRIGIGYYVSAHEMLHYTLEQRGIPGKLHHCLFVTERPGKGTLIRDVAQFLVDQKISSDYVVHMGANRENDFDPCGALSAEEKAAVARYAGELP